jgi:hypothetical protein
MQGAARVLAAVRAVPGVLACDLAGGELVVLLAPGADAATVWGRVREVAGPRPARLLGTQAARIRRPVPTPVLPNRRDDYVHRRRVRVAAAVVCASVPVGVGAVAYATRPRVITPHVQQAPPLALTLRPVGEITIVPTTTTTTTTTTTPPPPPPPLVHVP